MLVLYVVAGSFVVRADGKAPASPAADLAPSVGRPHTLLAIARAALAAHEPLSERQSTTSLRFATCELDAQVLRGLVKDWRHFDGEAKFDPSRGLGRHWVTLADCVAEDALGGAARWAALESAKTVLVDRDEGVVELLTRAEFLALGKAPEDWDALPPHGVGANDEGQAAVFDALAAELAHRLELLQAGAHALTRWAPRGEAMPRDLQEMVLARLGPAEAVAAGGLAEELWARKADVEANVVKALLEDPERRARAQARA